MLLVTGASGFAGRHLLEELKRHSPAVSDTNRYFLPLFNRNKMDGGVQVDLTDTEAVSKLIAKFAPSAVIHLAAETRPAICETDPEQAYLNNVVATQNLLDACNSHGKPYFLYTSTDMVFKGDHGFYRENQTLDAVSVYGRTKIDAEKLVQNYGGPWCIIRPALIYGAAIGGRQSSLTWTIDTIRSGAGHFFSDEIRTPVWIDDLVALILSVTETKGQGIIHAGGANRLSRLEFAHLAAKTWNLPETQIRSAQLASDPANAWRPRDLSLISDSALKYHPFTDVATALKRIRDKS